MRVWQASRPRRGPPVAVHFCTWVPGTLDSSLPPGGTVNLQMAALAGVQDTTAIRKIQQVDPTATSVLDLVVAWWLFQNKTEVNELHRGGGQSMAHQLTA